MTGDTYTKIYAAKNCQYGALTKMAAASQKSTTNSIWTASVSASADDDCSNELSLAEKMQYIASGLSLATAGVSLATNGKALFNSCKTNDTDGTSKGGGNEANQSVNNLSDALDKADDSGSWTQVKTELSNAESQLNQNTSEMSAAKDGSITQQKIIDACSSESGDTQYSTALQGINNKYASAKHDALTAYGKSKGSITANINTLKGQLTAETDDDKKAGLQKQIDEQEKALKEAKTTYDDAIAQADKVKENQISDQQKLMAVRKSDAQQLKSTYDEKYSNLKDTNDNLTKVIAEAKQKLADHGETTNSNASAKVTKSEDTGANA